VIGSRCGRFGPALELLRTGAVDVESLISEEFALADGVRAMERAAEPGVLKVLLRPEARAPRLLVFPAAFRYTAQICSPLKPKDASVRLLSKSDRQGFLRR